MRIDDATGGYDLCRDDLLYMARVMRDLEPPLLDDDGDRLGWAVTYFSQDRRYFSAKRHAYDRVPAPAWAHIGPWRDGREE